MKTMRFTEAVDSAIAQAMAEDERVVILGEDVPMLRRSLRVQFGENRVMGAPISEGAFLGAAVAAAMAGLRPIAEVYMVDFLSVGMDALLNHASKLEVFSGGRWAAPIVVRTPCGAGYGDGGQHGQALWGWLGHIPGLSVVVPSNPADAGALMYAALRENAPVLFMEHKLLSESWLEFLGSGGRSSVSFDVPAAGTSGQVPEKWERDPLGRAALRRRGDDVSIVSIGVGVHRSLAAAEIMADEGISCEVIDLRTVSPLDRQTVVSSVESTGRLLVVDEDYERFGLSGELSAVVLEADVTLHFRRVCTQETIPFALNRERLALPNVDRICAAVRSFFPESSPSG